MKKIQIILFSMLMAWSFIAKAQNKTWEGTWNSSYAELRLVQNGNKVYGDYGNNGTIEGTVSNSTLIGKFTNGNRKGTLNFVLDNNKFSGTWKFDDNSTTNNWSGTKTSSSRPTLIVYKGLQIAEQGNSLQDFAKQQGTLFSAAKTSTIYINEALPSNGKLSYVPTVNIENVTPEAFGGQTNIQNNNDDVLICKTYKQKFKADFNNLYLIQPDANILPGMILNGKDFKNGSIKSVTLTERLPMQVTIKGAGNNSKSGTINDFSISGINRVLTANKISYSQPLTSNLLDYSVESESEMKLGLSLSIDQESKAVGITGSKMKAGISTNISTKKTSKYFLIQFAETLFTANIDQPEMNTLANYGPSSLSQNDIIIKEVGYGRLLYFMVEVETAAKNMSFAINALQSTVSDVKAASQTSSINANVNAEDKSSEVKITVKALGAGIGVQPITVTDFNSLRLQISNLINQSKNGSGVPIYYKIARAKDFEELSTRIIDESTITECKVNKGTFKVGFDNVVVWETDEVGKDEIFGIGWCYVNIKKADGNIDRVPISKGNYAHTTQPRVFAIIPSEAKSIASGDGFTINNPVEYTIDARKYGYATLEEALENTTIKFVAELKEEDIGDNDIMGKEYSPEFTLDKAFISKMTLQQLKSKRNVEEDGIIKIQKGNARYGISYSIVPLED